MCDGYTATLRPATQDDIEILVKWDGDPELAWLMGCSHRTPEESRARLSKLIGDRNSVVMCIVDPDGHVVGDIVLTEIGWRRREAELSVRIGERENRGKGIGQQAVRQMLDFAFGRLGLNRVYLRVCADNLRAIMLPKVRVQARRRGEAQACRGPRTSHRGADDRKPLRTAVKDVASMLSPRVEGVSPLFFAQCQASAKTRRSAPATASTPAPGRRRTGISCKRPMGGSLWRKPTRRWVGATPRRRPVAARVTARAACDAVPSPSVPAQPQPSPPFPSTPAFTPRAVRPSLDAVAA